MISPGDQVSVLIEVNGPCGYYTEIAKIFVVDAEPTAALEEAFATAVECQDMIAAAMVPGADPGELWDKAVVFLTERGYARPGRSYAHGQGLSLVERPNIRADEPWKIAEGMNIAIHPGLPAKGVWARRLRRLHHRQERGREDPQDASDDRARVKLKGERACLTS